MATSAGYDGAALCATARVVDAALDGSALARLRTALSGPLVVVAAGATRPAAVLWARLHERAGHLAWVATPGDFISRGAPPGCAVLLVSVSGANQDILAAEAVATRSGARVFAAVCDAASPLAERLGAMGGVIRVPPPPLGEAFVGPQRGVPFSILAARLYGDQVDWRPALLGARPAPPPPNRPALVVSLGAGLAAPAAVDLAQRAVESGYAPAQCSDPRDFSHGGFMTVAARPEESLVVLFALPEQRAYLDRYCQAFPPSVRTVRLDATHAGIVGALELMTAGLQTFHAAMATHGPSPTYASVPAWGRALHLTPLAGAG